MRRLDERWDVSTIRRRWDVVDIFHLREHSVSGKVLFVIRCLTHWPSCHRVIARQWDVSTMRRLNNKTMRRRWDDDKKVDVTAHRNHFCVAWKTKKLCGCQSSTMRRLDERWDVSTNDETSRRWDVSMISYWNGTTLERSIGHDWNRCNAVSRVNQICSMVSTRISRIAIPTRVWVVKNRWKIRRLVT